MVCVYLRCVHSGECVCVEFCVCVRFVLCGDFAWKVCIKWCVSGVGEWCVMWFSVEWCVWCGVM